MTFSELVVTILKCIGIAATTTLFVIAFLIVDDLRVVSWEVWLTTRGPLFAGILAALAAASSIFGAAVIAFDQWKLQRSEIVQGMRDGLALELRRVDLFDRGLVRVINLALAGSVEAEYAQQQIVVDLQSRVPVPTPVFHATVDKIGLLEMSVRAPIVLFYDWQHIFERDCHEAQRLFENTVNIQEGVRQLVLLRLRLRAAEIFIHGMDARIALQLDAARNQNDLPISADELDGVNELSYLLPELVPPSDRDDLAAWKRSIRTWIVSEKESVDQLDRKIESEFGISP